MREHSFALGLSVRTDFINADLEVDTFTTLRLQAPGEHVHCCPNFQPRGSPPVARKRVRRSNLGVGRRPRCLCPRLRQWYWSLCQRTTSRPTQVVEDVRMSWWWKFGGQRADPRVIVYICLFPKSHPVGGTASHPRNGTGRALRDTHILVTNYLLLNPKHSLTEQHLPCEQSSKTKVLVYHSSYPPRPPLSRIRPVPPTFALPFDFRPPNSLYISRMSPLLGRDTA